jgi:hypothetical protein
MIKIAIYTFTLVALKVPGYAKRMDFGVPKELRWIRVDLRKAIYGNSSWDMNIKYWTEIWLVVNNYK